MNFGDGIDWDKEAQRAAEQSEPGASPGDMLINICEALGPLEKPRIVDCGCNIGRFYPQFSHAGFSYVGVDQAPEAIAIARLRWPTHFEHCFLWDSWPNRFPAFDAALCNAVLQHNTHAEKRLILTRVAEAVRLGGVFGMQESVVLGKTKTQLLQAEWIALVEEFGFRLLKTWHRNQEYDLNDAFLFRRV